MTIGSVAPWTSSVPATTVKAASTRTGRCGVDSGRANTAASVTTPRIPAHDTPAGTCQGGGGSTRPMAGIRRGRYVAGNTHTKRLTMVASRTPPQMSRSRPPPSDDFDTSSSTSRTWSPMRRKTEFSRTNWMVSQLSRSEMRARADCS